MLHAVILFCRLAIAPVDCDEVHASRYERVPGGHTMTFMCLYAAQVWAAEHGIAPAEGEYPKVRCSRTEFGGRVG